MVKKEKFIKIFISLILVVTIIHLSLHFTFFGTGISGLSIGEEKVGEDLSPASSNSLTSLIFLAVEWTLLLGGFIFAYTQYRLSLKKEYEELLVLRSKKQPEGKKTEIDYLYDFLKEKKHFKISAIAKAFGVDKELVEDWAKTLEGANLVTITYPRIGSPEIIINEESTSQKQFANA